MGRYFSSLSCNRESLLSLFSIVLVRWLQMYIRLFVKVIYIYIYIYIYMSSLLLLPKPNEVEIFASLKAAKKE